MVDSAIRQKPSVRPGALEGSFKSLMNAPVHGQEATTHYNHQQEWAAWEARRQQEIAALPEIYRRITLAFRRIWWIADVH